MKIRSLHPQFFSDRELAAMSLRARLLYQGLWVYADDHGRGEWLPKHIEGAIFPFEDLDFEAVWFELEEAGKVVVYEVDGRPYFHLPNFSKWQKPKYVRESKIPAPPKSTPERPDDNASQDKAREASPHSVPKPGTNQGQAGTRVPRQAVAAAAEVEVEVEAVGGGGVEGEPSSPNGRHPTNPIDLPCPADIPKPEWAIACQLATKRIAEGYQVNSSLGGFVRTIWRGDRDLIDQALARDTPIDTSVAELLAGIGADLPEDT